MPAEFNHVDSGALMVGGAWAAVMIFVQLREIRHRLADLGLKASDALRLGAAASVSVYPFWSWFLGSAFICQPGISREPHSPVFAWFLVAFLLLQPFLLTILWDVIRPRLRKPPPVLLSRGALFSGIDALARKAPNRRLGLYVLPDDFRAQLLPEHGPAALIPRRFLDSMSCAEIDALAARQLTRQRQEYLLPSRASLLGCGLAAVGLCELLNAGIAGRWLALLVLIAVETAALALYFPRAEVNADLRAIRLTGDPDAFFSAVGESARLTRAALDLPEIEKIAQRAGVSTDRLRALLQPQPRLAEDRYPTSGDYATVGF